MTKCKDCKHFEERILGGVTYYECLRIFNMSIYDKEFEHKCNTFETKMDIHREIAEQYQGLFNPMSKQHNLTLTISEMDEIIIEAQKAVNNTSPKSDVVGQSEQFSLAQLWVMAQKYNCDDFIKMVEEIEG